MLGIGLFFVGITLKSTAGAAYFTLTTAHLL